MNELTYGETPAAMYLARVVAQLNDEGFARTVGKRISGTSRAVNELVNAYECGHLSAATVANSLRLMREEVSKDGVERGKSLYNLADHLRRNVQIGHIKRAMRLCQVARKVERVMANPDKRGRAVKSAKYSTTTEYHFTDAQSGRTYVAGYRVEYMDRRETYLHDIYLDDVQTVTPELLHARSEARCKRLRKPHTL